MKLTAEQAQAALVALNRFWVKPKRCEVCHRHDWTISPTVFELREFHGGDLNLISSDLVPLIVAVCQTCGHTLTFNAIKLGILSPHDLRGPVAGPYIRTGDDR